MNVQYFYEEFLFLPLDIFSIMQVISATNHFGISFKILHNEILLASDQHVKLFEEPSVRSSIGYTRKEHFELCCMRPISVSRSLCRQSCKSTSMHHTHRENLSCLSNYRSFIHTSLSWSLDESENIDIYNLIFIPADLNLTSWQIRNVAIEYWLSLI